MVVHSAETSPQSQEGQGSSPEILAPKLSGAANRPHPDEEVLNFWIANLQESIGSEYWGG